MSRPDSPGPDSSGPGYLPYFYAVMAGAWLVLAIASARNERWPIAAVCVVLFVSFAWRLYRVNRR